MLYVFIGPKWLPELPSIQKDCTFEEALKYNDQGYHVYNYPNYPSTPGKDFIKADEVDVFEWVFVDLDEKHGAHTRDSFSKALSDLPECSRIVESGNGVHVYWRVVDLTPMAFLRLQRRLARALNTDPAVAQLKQLMRVPGTINTKNPTEPKQCKEILTDNVAYTCEEMDKALPPITREDEEYCQQHYNKAYNKETELKISDELPKKFLKLLRESKDIAHLYGGVHKDRSKSDFKLAHMLYADGFTKDEALSVLVNCNKALERSVANRQAYAVNIVDKIWQFETDPDAPLSSSVKDILKRGTSKKGERLACWDVLDGTASGFRLTQVLGLVGGSGSGKTTLALNYFYHFTHKNPDYIHLFVSLEQPEEEIAERWVKITQGREELHDRVHVLSNYNSDSSFRNLSLSEIEDYIIDLEKRLKRKVGCVVIDHIGILKKLSKDGENQGLMDICHGLKAFAKRTNTFLVIQSQTSREKAGMGDLELDKDAAYGTTMFEWYCDYLVTTWQPLKRIYTQAPNMTCNAIKYCKIRHKHVKLDKVKEDTVYVVMYDIDTELLSEMTQDNEQSYEYWNNVCTTQRNKDRKREPTKITRIDWTGNNNEPKAIDIEKPQRHR